MSQPASLFPPDIIAAAQASEDKWDIPASVSLAQWALESAWGKFMPTGSNNPFGIKATAGQTAVSSVTREVVHGKTITIIAHFRKFASLAEAFEAHGQLLATAKPYAAARLVRHNAEAFAKALTGVYATDPNYGPKLIAIMRAHNLAAFNKPKAPAPLNPVKALLR